MLVLARQEGQTINISRPGEPHKTLGSIRIVDIRGDKVRLGFDFPENVQVDRDEITQAKQATRPA